MPVGVVGQIIPWNFPLLMLAWKIAPALAMGNTVVLKPAEFTPLTALLFAELVEEAGLPPGVVNIITGDGRTGEALVTHPGRRQDRVHRLDRGGPGHPVATAGSGKRISLELGGKSPFIVFDDADLDSVVEGVVDAIWFNQGQVCCAGSRLLVQESIAERLVRKLRARMETLRVGDPLDKARRHRRHRGAGAARADRAAGEAGRGGRRRSAGSPAGAAPPTAGSIRRRCSPMSRRPPPSRRRRSSGRCWWR